MRKIIFPALLFLLAINGCSNSVGNIRIDRILEDPGTLEGKAIAVTACFGSQRHGISLFDCDTPDKMLIADFTAEALATKAGKSLLAAGYEQWPPKSQVKIEVNVVGTVKKSDEQGRGTVFIISKVDSFRVSTLK